MVNDMAIFNIKNTRNSGAKDFHEILRYISASEKNEWEDITDRTERFRKLTTINRYLYNKENAKRYFKHEVLSLASEWSNDEEKKEEIYQKLYQVARNIEMTSMEDGFYAISNIHTNMAHPHLHIVIETCNAINGKQLSQSKWDLKKEKEIINQILRKAGIDEQIIEKDINQWNDNDYYNNYNDYADDYDEYHYQNDDYYDDEEDKSDENYYEEYNDTVEPVETKQLFEPVTSKKLVEPVTKKLVEPVPRNLVEPVPRNLVEPVTKKLVEPVTKKLVEPVTKKLVEPVTRNLVKPVTKRLVESIEEKNMV